MDPAPSVRQLWASDAGMPDVAIRLSRPLAAGRQSSTIAWLVSILSITAVIFSVVDQVAKRSDLKSSPTNTVCPRPCRCVCAMDQAGADAGMLAPARCCRAIGPVPQPWDRSLVAEGRRETGAPFHLASKA